MDNTHNRRGRHDVFISFRGPDTRNNFVDHLYDHLTRKGISVFKDDKRLEKGESLSPQLVQAIKNSRISIVVFSERYVESKWCLEEMATIAECSKEFNQKVFPVFYAVDPSHVRNQNGVYRKAFVLHKKKFKRDLNKVVRWTNAMNVLANFVGWDVRNKPEFQEIKNIVQQVIKTLGHKLSGFADDLIGIQPRVEELDTLMDVSSTNDKFRVIGVWGMSGIGKTTLASALYDKVSGQFDASCFIENVSRIYKDGGANAVMKQILQQTMDENNLETYRPSEISSIVRNRLCNRKLLVVLDNVDLLDQVEELAINPESLSTGSRMIITTRDMHILKAYGTWLVSQNTRMSYQVYEVPLLNNNDARELFYRKAFKSKDPTNGCVKLTPEVLNYVQGLPLAVRVVGSFLRTRNAGEWRDALNRLRNNPDKEVMDVLQEDYVTRILDACELHPLIGIQSLVERSLIAIRDEEIYMHDMLQELGKKIVRQQFPGEPGLWSRLWLYQDVYGVMTTQTGTNKVKAIILNKKGHNSEYRRLRADGLSIMQGLQILILYHNDFSGSLKFLSNSLQYLEWHGYPFASLPLNFEPYGLVELNMPCSSIQRLWNDHKDLPCLKRGDLSNSKCLVETPNFSGSKILEQLDLTGCINLSYVHPSIGLLEKLVFLSFEGCRSLVRIVLHGDTASNLCSLKVLHLSGCTKLETIPEFTGVSNLEYLDIDQCTSLSIIDQSIGDLTQLKFLSLRDCTNLVSIPESINSMTSLVALDLCGCLKLENVPLGKVSASADKLTSSSSHYMKSLIFLDLSFCNLSIVPDAIGELRHLERLNLEGNNFVSLPSSMGSLYSLAYLNLTHCTKLQSLPDLKLCATCSSGGSYFKMISGTHNHRSGLYIYNCPLLKIGEKSQDLAVSWLHNLAQSPHHFRGGFDIIVPGENIPDRFDRKFKGRARVRVRNYMRMYKDWIGCVFGVVFEGPKFGSSHHSDSWAQHCCLYLSFENEETEETFDIPIRLDLNSVALSNENIPG
ncbi:hypothetical protein KIW84_057049 [Lathyrus oleraceus]|uniref:TIR domain-containing protein n=2 Tax=Pisum sativum TaxID=3888 RepID=A0A9D4X252_PEA|nr:hypothetical protein KIW84_057049 [Pisum sativum]